MREDPFQVALIPLPSEIVPPLTPAAVTVIKYCFSEKVAVTVLSEPMTIGQTFPPLPGQPVHPLNSDVTPAAAVSCTDVPSTKNELHPEPKPEVQAMPDGLLVTVPTPAPAMVTLMFRLFGIA